MSKYAVIKIQGHQYKVSEKDEILVDLIDPKTKPQAEVFLMVDEDKVQVGKPIVKGAKVELKVIESIVAGDKIYVKKFKAKSRYRRKIGFRPKYTKLLVQKVS